jgi:hypothetical protein
MKDPNVDEFIQRKKKPMKSRVLLALLFASGSLFAQTQPVLVAMKASTRPLTGLFDGGNL